MKRLLADPTRLIFIGTLALLVAGYHSFLFVTPWHEDGDFALNALQIERAKHLNEFYGNYSRFHFNHPGPAFFYVYAVGEYVLHDWLQVVPSPHNAHAIAGTMLQAFFFALALGIAADWIRSRWFIPLALAAAGLHFGLAREAFVSIWPPHVLLMPFLCLLVAAASVAAGAMRHLPLLVLSGCFLVHGHVAQPLMVGVLFLTAYGLFWQTQRAGGITIPPWKAQPGPHWIAAACIAVFMIPFLVDLTLGRDSNFAEILRFFLAKKPHRSFIDSLVYLLSFFGYERSQELFIPERGGINFAFLRQGLAAYAGWAIVLAFIAGRTRGFRHLPRGTDAERFVRALILVTGAGFVTAVLWGWIQNGPMFAFNSHFYYALLYAVALIAAGLLTPLLPERGAWLGGGVLVVAGALATWSLRTLPPSVNNADTAWVTATAAALRTDPRPEAPKFLVFNHDDWGDVARTALALKRSGHSYRVDESWQFMFGRYRSINADDLDTLENYSVWRFSHNPLAGPGVLLGRGLRVFHEPGTINPDDATIECRRSGNFEQYVLFGFTTPDENFTWSNLTRSAFQFRSAHPAIRDVGIEIDAQPFLPAARKSQPMRLFVNGGEVARFDLSTKATVRARVPAALWNARTVVTLRLDFPAAETPRADGSSDDPRALAWAISAVRFRALD
ncbi:hypothetical protein [Oleiharenicola sp. Vm1]|uniref:hypothetical protein n=1 Tax=Oleiharenicola sp. Vm1 TaxID=3398393 RepID=UPI0039F55817